MGGEALPKSFRIMVLVSLVIHAVLVALILWSGQLHSRRPAHSVLTTQLVRLGEKRPENLLPRKEVAPPDMPTAPVTPIAPPVPIPAPQAPKATIAKAAPVEVKPAQAKAMQPLQHVEKPEKQKSTDVKTRVQELARVSSALERLKNKKPEPPTGDRSGVAEGEITDARLAIEGNKFMTAVYHCIKSNYAVEGLDPSMVEGAQAEVAIRVQADGTLIDYRIVKSSGRMPFDRAVLAAVKRCGKVEPPDAVIRSVVGKEGILIDFRP